MWDNIGQKIKDLAKGTFIGEIIITVIAAFIFILIAINEDADMLPYAFLIIIGGIAAAWISSWLLYGYGELIDKACEIERNTRGASRSSTPQPKADPERIEKLKRLRDQGLITEEEFQKAISRRK